MCWVVLEMAQIPRGAMELGQEAVETMWWALQTDCLNSHPVHNSIWGKGTQKYSWNILDKMWSLEVDRKVYSLLNLGCGPWGVRNCPTALRGDAVSICGEVLKLIQFQDPHPASKDSLESWRQFHTWIPSHNGWALKCVVGRAPMMH